MEDLDLLKQTVLFTGEDERYLRMAGDVLEDQVEDVLDAWYGFVGDHPHLIHYFSNPDGKLAKLHDGLPEEPRLAVGPTGLRTITHCKSQISVIIWHN